MALYFNNCTVGHSYNYEFSIWNRSEFPVRFVINSTGPANAGLLSFTSYTSSEEMRHGTIEPAGYVRVRVTFTPRTLGDVHLGFTVCNLDSTWNKFTAWCVCAAKDHIFIFTYCYRHHHHHHHHHHFTHLLTCLPRVNAMVVAAVPMDLLIVDSFVDFGSCYTGQSYVKPVRIKNIHNQVAKSK